MEKELKDKVDFVVWTGDSARHDNDEDLPRNEAQVIELNQFMVDKMFEVFGKKGDDEEDDNPNSDYVIPIIPTMGNNDILPHNIFRKGPNKWTRTYTRIWKQFIPEEQKHQFEQGGWFYVEVIRNKLAVFSLNTIYYFKSNAAVDGCAIPSEPGYKQMEWLRIQLQFLRERGMKAILTGHVPPAREVSKWSWYETCWQKHTLWLRQYRDVVVGSLYGHFNYDHFILQDFENLKKGAKRGKMPDYDGPSWYGDNVRAKVSSSYFTELRDGWASLPDPPESLQWPQKVGSGFDQHDESEGLWSRISNGLLDALKSKNKERKEKKFFEQIGGEFAERFAASFVIASVVPNLFPSLRVFEYNISGVDTQNDWDDAVPLPSLPEWSEFDYYNDDVEVLKKPKYKFQIPDPPSKSSPPGPAYSPQTFSLVRFTQYLANLTHINNDFQSPSSTSDDLLDATKWKEGKHKGKKPHNKDHTPDPRKFKFEVHYDTKDDNVYQLDDLTMPRLVDLARRIGNFVPEDEILETIGDGDVDAKRGKKKKKKKKEQRKLNEVWWAFVRRAYVETLSSDELQDEFGAS